ncbi:MAG: LysR family transcriptional regulator substrate-binding protein [Oscillospiraceae bacterium]|nr:LysR family transcriptional regulator substrate-binding protein [Oscillospiraceae bacterium]
MPHISGCIPDFIALFPEVQFSYTEAWDPALRDLVRNGSLDMALVALPKNRESRAGLTVFPLREEHVCVVVSNDHPLHDRASVSLADLAREEIVSTSGQSGLQGLMKEEFARHGLEPNFTMNLVSIEARLSMVRKGAVTFVMSEQFKIYNERNLSVIPVEPKIYRTFALITAADHKLTTLEKTFQQVIQDGLLNRLGSEESRD